MLAYLVTFGTGALVAFVAIWTCVVAPMRAARAAERRRLEARIIALTAEQIRIKSKDAPHAERFQTIRT